MVSETDKVLAWCPLPSGSRLHKATFDFQTISSSKVSVHDAVGYGMSMYVFPVPDPDAATAIDTLWDNMVPKDETLAGGVGADEIDMDTGTADDKPETEWGEPNIERILGVSATPVRLFHRTRLITFARAKGGYDQTAADYYPTDEFISSVDKGVHVDVPSFAVIGMSSPLMDVTSTTKWVPTDEDQ